MSTCLPRAFAGTVASAVLAGALQIFAGITAAEEPAVGALSKALDPNPGEWLANLGDVEQLARGWPPNRTASWCGSSISPAFIMGSGSSQTGSTSRRISCKS